MFWSFAGASKIIINIAIVLFVFCRFLRELIVIPIYFLKQTVYYLQTGFPSREKAVKLIETLRNNQCTNCLHVEFLLPRKINNSTWPEHLQIEKFYRQMLCFLLITKGNKRKLTFKGQLQTARNNQTTARTQCANS